MLTKEELKSIVLKNQEDLKRDLGIKRDFQVKQIDKFATIISGVRRSGKSTLIRQFLNNKKPVYYMYFEDVALANFKVEEFERLDASLKENLGKDGVYFFDEIQNIEGWEIYIRQLVDRGEKVFITGSNASMLSRELGTRLTGRNLRYELHPFSYNEFLTLRRNKASVKTFTEYLVEGGFPEYLKSSDKDILRNLFQDVLYRDILVRNDIRNESALKSLLSYLSSNIGKELSFNKLKSLINVGSVNTVSQFIEAFESAYLFFTLKKYDHSIKKQLINPKKIYCVDNALIQFNSFATSPNLGRLLENLVFIELKRREYELFYFREKYECDFVVRKDNKTKELIQVCYKFNSENKDREINGLLEAMNSFRLKKGLILTNNQEDEFRVEGKKIIMKPVWKWLCK